MSEKIIVTEPKGVSEFEVHASLWFRLKQLGINARGEVKAIFQSSNKRARCRFDIAIFETGQLTGIIEIKSAPRKHKTDKGWLGTRQGDRYTTYGVPVAIVYGHEQAESFLSDAIECGGVPWEKWKVN